MIKIAALNKSEREELFLNTSEKAGLPPAIIEKDFWVCYMLDYLFHRCRWKEKFVFKGGTSLSKAYHLIKRFSEDIDLILDWRVLGYAFGEPWETRSNTKQDKFSVEAEKKTIDFLVTEFIPEISKDISEEIGFEADIYLESADEPTVNFAYPQSFSDHSILQVIRLEIGALASWSPTKDAEIISFSAEMYPQIFSKKKTMIRTAIPERTFWEKVTILHREANRKQGKFPYRYSRHYYDLYCMCFGDVKERALQNIDLLNNVIAFKKKFYRCPWAKYEEAVPGTLKLIPSSEYLDNLAEDYVKMRQMLYGDIPEFAVIMNKIRDLEQEINGTIK